MASYPRCTCGIVKNHNKQFTARFEFKCSSDQVEVVPQSGILYSNRFIQVNFHFKPQLKEKIEEDETKSKKDDKSLKRGKN